jgi:WD40 repeat protein
LQQVDREGVPLPPLALARLGSTRWRHSGNPRALGGENNIIFLDNLETGRQTHPGTDRELAIYSAQFTRHGRSLILHGADGSIRIRDWTTGYERRCWRSAGIGSFDSPLPIALSPDGRLLAEAIDNKTICLRDVQSNKKVRTFPTAEEVWLLGFSPDGEILIGVTLKRDQLWSLRTGKEVRMGGNQFEALSWLLFSPDGRWFASQEGIVVLGQTRKVYLWDRITGRIVYAIKGQGNWISLHGFSPDGRMLAGTDDHKRNLTNQLVLWDTATGAERLRLPAYGESIQTMAFSPDGRTLALGCRDGTIHLWEVATGKVRQSLPGDQGAIRALAFSDDGDRLVSTGENGTALVWDVGRRRQVEETRRISRHEFEECWRALSDFDAARAFKAQQTLASAPRSALEFLRRRLRPVVAPEPELVQRLIADLDSESYPVRERAMRQLEQLGDGTEVYLRRALRQRPSLELRRRVERLLETLTSTSPRHLRDGRLLEVLEWLDTAESRRLLEELAGGAADVWLTCEAKAALKRRTAR